MTVTGQPSASGEGTISAALVVDTTQLEAAQQGVSALSAQLSALANRKVALKFSWGTNLKQADATLAGIEAKLAGLEGRKAFKLPVELALDYGAEIARINGLLRASKASLPVEFMGLDTAQKTIDKILALNGKVITIPINFTTRINLRDFLKRAAETGEFVVSGKKLATLSAPREAEPAVDVKVPRQAGRTYQLQLENMRAALAQAADAIEKDAGAKIKLPPIDVAAAVQSLRSLEAQFVGIADKARTLDLKTLREFTGNEAGAAALKTVHRELDGIFGVMQQAAAVNLIGTDDLDGVRRFQEELGKNVTGLRGIKDFEREAVATYDRLRTARRSSGAGGGVDATENRETARLFTALGDTIFQTSGRYEDFKRVEDTIARSTGQVNKLLDDLQAKQGALPGNVNRASTSLGNQAVLMERLIDETRSVDAAMQHAGLASKLLAIGFDDAQGVSVRLAAAIRGEVGASGFDALPQEFYAVRESILKLNQTDRSVALLDIMNRYADQQLGKMPRWKQVIFGVNAELTRMAVPVAEVTSLLGPYALAAGVAAGVVGGVFIAAVKTAIGVVEDLVEALGAVSPGMKRQMDGLKRELNLVKAEFLSALVGGPQEAMAAVDSLAVVLNNFRQKIAANRAEIHQALPAIFGLIDAFRFLGGAAGILLLGLTVLGEGFRNFYTVVGFSVASVIALMHDLYGEFKVFLGLAEDYEEWGIKIVASWEKFKKGAWSGSDGVANLVDLFLDLTKAMKESLSVDGDKFGRFMTDYADGIDRANSKLEHLVALKQKQLELEESLRAEQSDAVASQIRSMERQIKLESYRLGLLLSNSEIISEFQKADTTPGLIQRAPETPARGAGGAPSDEPGGVNEIGAGTKALNKARKDAQRRLEVASVGIGRLRQRLQELLALEATIAQIDVNYVEQTKRMDLSVGSRNAFYVEQLDARILSLQDEREKLEAASDNLIRKLSLQQEAKTPLLARATAQQSRETTAQLTALDDEIARLERRRDLANSLNAIRRESERIGAESFDLSDDYYAAQERLFGLETRRKDLLDDQLRLQGLLQATVWAMRDQGGISEDEAKQTEPYRKLEEQLRDVQKALEDVGIEQASVADSLPALERLRDLFAAIDARTQEAATNVADFSLGGWVQSISDARTDLLGAMATLDALREKQQAARLFGREDIARSLEAEVMKARGEVNMKEDDLARLEKWPLDAAQTLEWALGNGAIALTEAIRGPLNETLSVFAEGGPGYKMAEAFEDSLSDVGGSLLGTLGGSLGAAFGPFGAALGGTLFGTLGTFIGSLFERNIDTEAELRARRDREKRRERQERDVSEILRRLADAVGLLDGIHDNTTAALDDRRNFRPLQVAAALSDSAQQRAQGRIGRFNAIDRRLHDGA